MCAGDLQTDVLGFSSPYIDDDHVPRLAAILQNRIGAFHTFRLTEIRDEDAYGASETVLAYEGDRSFSDSSHSPIQLNSRGADQLEVGRNAYTLKCRSIPYAFLARRTVIVIAVRLFPNSADLQALAVDTAVSRPIFIYAFLVGFAAFTFRRDSRHSDMDGYNYFAFERVSYARNSDSVGSDRAVGWNNNR